MGSNSCRNAECGHLETSDHDLIHVSPRLMESEEEANECRTHTRIPDSYISIHTMLSVLFFLVVTVNAISAAIM
jgi:hypothetical protein